MTVGLDKYGETRRKPGGDAEAASQGFTLSEGPGPECHVPLSPGAVADGVDKWGGGRAQVHTRGRDYNSR